jgi:hypothetical protein
MISRKESCCIDVDNQKYKEKVDKIKSKDIVSMRTIWRDAEERYLVIRVSRSKSFIDVLPLEPFFVSQEKVEAPILSVPFYMIENVKKMDKANLLFLANRPNPHIVNALEGV